MFSTNQNRQFYVALATASGDHPATLGDIKGFKDNNGMLYFEYYGKGGPIRSDLIDPLSIEWAKVSNKKIPLKKVTISAKSNTAFVGQDYIVKVNFNIDGMSPENTYQKFAAVHATSAMVSSGNVTSAFYIALAHSLFKNFNRLTVPLIDIYVTESTAKQVVSVDASGNIYTTGGTKITTPTDIILVEKSQASIYKRGTMPYKNVIFNVSASPVYDSTNAADVNWATITEGTDATGVNNGYKLADLEYFCMGERGDQYRYKGWPNVIDTEYMITPSTNYYVLDLHYSYVGENHAIQKSEKTITVATATQAVLTALLSAWGIPVDSTYSLPADQPYVISAVSDLEGRVDTLEE